MKAEPRKRPRKCFPPEPRGFAPGVPIGLPIGPSKTPSSWTTGEGFATYDIGCYAMGRGPAGYYQLRMGGAMGSGTGLASGFGKFSHLGFEQPVIAMCGDSTFFHAAMPALVNAHYNKSNLVMVILDNSATAMTGFQPHPGVGRNAMGENVTPVDIEGVCRAFGAKVEVTDPFDLPGTREKLLRALEDPGGESPDHAPAVPDAEGSGREASLQGLGLTPRNASGKLRLQPPLHAGFQMPRVDLGQENEKARVDEVICVGCGVCADICPEGAIQREGRNK